MTQNPVLEAVTGEQSDFKRDVGLMALTFISLGSIIGSGWLLGALTAAKSAGGASIVSWVLAGVVIVLLALVHSELGAAYPLAGGTARWPRLAFGALCGFTSGWVSWLQAVTIAPIEVEAALSYLDHLVHGLINKNGALTPIGLGAAAILMLLFTVINTRGVRWLAESNRITVLWKTAVPVLTVIVFIWVWWHASNSAAGGVSNFTAGGGFAPYGAHGVLAALPLGVVFALQGFEQAAQISGEARDPQRNVPRAVIGAVIVGTVLYLALEIAFIGALNPANLRHGWAAPVSTGDFGPYATLATSLGLGWLAVILYFDAFISPAGTGLVYMGTSARLSFALSHARFVHPSLRKINGRGVPHTSIILSCVVGLICLLPFPSWQSLVSLVTSATVIMYAFAPITLLALRKADPDRPRPYRLPMASILAPAAFIAANEIIYWSSWQTVWKLMLAIGIGYLILGISPLVDRPMERPPLDAQSLIWILPWFLGLVVISRYGQYGGTGLIPEWVDLGVVAVFSLMIFFMAVRLGLPAHQVAAAIKKDECGTQSADAQS
jgi:amino acid transporter